MTVVIVFLLEVLKIYSYILLAYAFISWIPNAYDSSIGRLLTSLVRPILVPFQRFKLQFLGVDWTIVLVLFLIHNLSRILSWLL
ncbi:MULTISPECIES: YggT family protein [unclassified Streptococcus]|uniref:YggT family protein n=1 Tax=unclassified Streptococcus TaxID=2608887 RepID=UPI001072564F|nr:MULTISPECIES: YggT family protein [unclassified Streptococcus]MBF0786829.1 YggT family protein [Streptococcus sp. 19428wC2_LYSM12]MCQ9211069.1 YggT family protein [Streptococcus sp. B01]MCQ9214344.1 YggT family protein [Streptococcus sp. O1]TFV06372.1 YggT family protein [Streptococcus sp. LYSM12]